MITPMPLNALLKRNEKRIDDLVSRQPEIAIALENCSTKHACGQLICAACSEARRLPYLQQIRQLVEDYQGPYKIATIFIASLPAGDLAQADLHKCKDTLRRKLQRAGLRDGLLVGGTEAGWSEQRQTWTIHIHALAVGVPNKIWELLTKALKSADAHAALVCQDLREPDYQISYLLKFVTLHWPGARSGRARGHGVPLHPDRLAELAAWWSQYRFDDFPFLIGARRRRGRIVVEAGSQGTAREAYVPTRPTLPTSKLGMVGKNEQPRPIRQRIKVSVIK